MNTCMDTDKGTRSCMLPTIDIQVYATGFSTDSFTGSIPTILRSLQRSGLPV
jgi:hypothetical protein